MKKLILPSLRARMGDWVYYIRVKMVGDIHKSSKLRDLIQREVTDRSEQIKNYLLKQQQRFFNSIIVGVYGGSPRWFEMSFLKSVKLEIPPSIRGALGILTLQGDENFFAIDGQHRVAAIKDAVQKNRKLASDEVSVIFISHRRDSAGMERTRRLFATLNRYAKPVDKMEVIALDEDDAIAITTRSLLDYYPFFSGRILIKKGKSIPVSDKVSFTTIIVLYDVLDLILLDISGKKKDDFKRFRPPDNKLKQMYSEAKNFWDLMIKHFAPLKEIKSSSRRTISVEKYRNKDGGNLLFRPVGLLSIARAIADSTKAKYQLEETIKRISKIDLDLTKEPWRGLLWDNFTKKMITRKENQAIATSLILYMIGYDLSELGIDVEKLRINLAGKLNKPEEKVQLPQKVFT